MTLKHRILPSERINLLKILLNSGRKLRIMEAHDGLSAWIANTTLVSREQLGVIEEPIQYDGIWISSLTDSAAKGLPDTGVVDVSSRLQTIQEVALVTNKLIIVDGDTGGDANQFEYFCSALENMGVSAVIIEDKQFPKRNSLEIGAIQNLEDPKVFAKKINRAKESCLTKDFMIFARIESFIAGLDIDEALFRARIYLESQADGIFIHSNKTTPDQVYAFMDQYNELCQKIGIRKPVVCVPTTYNQTYDHELFEHGFDIIIYANHLLRAAHKGMRQVSDSILATGRPFDATHLLSSVKEIFVDVGFLDVTARDAKYEEQPLPVIILAAGRPIGLSTSVYKDSSISNVLIRGKTLLNRQVEVCRNLGLKDITLISGFGAETFESKDIKVVYNKDHSTTKALGSLFLVKDQLKNGFILIFGDIIFDQGLLMSLMRIDKDIVIVVDPSINMQNKKEVKPSADFVVAAYRSSSLRQLNMETERIMDIGTDIDPQHATHEFVGIVKFSQYGGELLMSIYSSMLNQTQLKESNDNHGKTIHQFDLNDLLREMIHQGCNIEALSVNKGWAEIRSVEDISSVEGLLS